MASVVPYKKGFRVFAEWRGQRATKTCTTKREATAWGVTKEAEMAAAGTSSRLNFKDACIKYLATVSTRKRDASVTWEGHRFTAFRLFFGDETLMKNIDSDLAGEWRDHRLTTVLSSTVLREYNLIRNLFSVAKDEWKVIDRNPFTKLRMPEDQPPREVVWGWQAIKRVLRAERSGKTAEVIHAFHISLHTGRRLSEVINGKFHKERKVFELTTSKTSTRRNFFPVPRRALKLFPAHFTVDPNEASTLFSKLHQELDIKGLTFRDARATAVTLMARRMDVMTLARISGHKDLKLLFDTYYRETADAISART